MKPELKTKREAKEILKHYAAANGKTLEEFIDTDVRAILEKIWEIQQRTGKPVSLDRLYKELYHV